VNPAIHFDDFTRHEIGGIATDEDRNSSNFIGLRKSPQWRSLCDIIDQLVSPAFRHFCHCQARAHGIYCYVELSQAKRECPRQRDHPSFGGGIGWAAHKRPHSGRVGRSQNDAATTLIAHVRHHGLDQKICAAKIDAHYLIPDFWRQIVQLMRIQDSSEMQRRSRAQVGDRRRKLDKGRRQGTDVDGVRRAVELDGLDRDQVIGLVRLAIGDRDDRSFACRQTVGVRNRYGQRVWRAHLASVGISSFRIVLCRIVVGASVDPIRAAMSKIENIVAGAAEHQIIAARAIKRIDPPAADQQVIARRTVESIAAASAEA
jgi:hypothetical protein